MGDCKADWAISINTAIEGRVKTQWNGSRLLDFSDKYLVDCHVDAEEEADGCSGVDVVEALEWIESEDIQIPRNYQYTYTDVQGTCPELELNADSRVSVTSHTVYENPTFEETFELLTTSGPLIAEIQADTELIENFDNRKLEECLDDEEGNEDTYFVNIVGFHFKPWSGEIEWRVKFPFGRDWGHQGYAYIPVTQDVEDSGICGIRQRIITVEVSPESQS